MAKKRTYEGEGGQQRCKRRGKRKYRTQDEKNGERGGEYMDAKEEE